jgi:putative ubiquitin-RnfH superfamily antitoxin RatB of RatAB toxin-antitoxin module
MSDFCRIVRIIRIRIIVKIGFEYIQLTSILKTNTNTNIHINIFSGYDTDNLDFQTSESIPSAPHQTWNLFDRFEFDRPLLVDPREQNSRRACSTPFCKKKPQEKEEMQNYCDWALYTATLVGLCLWAYGCRRMKLLLFLFLSFSVNRVVTSFWLRWCEAILKLPF